MKKILIYGGSFNPPTLAHVALIKIALSMPDFDAVWLMPSKDRLDKSISTPAQVRTKMLQTMIDDFYPKGNARLLISGIEINLPGKTNTQKTVKELAKKFPNFHFTWLIGMDSWLAMDSWVNGATLKRTGDWLVSTRGSYDTPWLPKNARLIKLTGPELTMSSSQVRNLCAQHLAVDSLVSPGVNKFIHDHNLYC
jgi:nicotinate-nucleotide adenylyltransferase